MIETSIREQVLLTCRRILSHLNRDPATTSNGCFDRRYWAWKLADFPEATFQRNVAPLAWYLKQEEVQDKSVLTRWIINALLFSAHIQHRDGSFDQAYPFERSYGATAFLLPDLIGAYEAISPSFSHQENDRILACITRAADFLSTHSEQHGLISNHVAGAALGLLQASNLIGSNMYKQKSDEIVRLILSNQSTEGWFPEYGGADPGYQTLCMYYLAQIYHLQPTKQLKEGLEKSLAFLSFFAHPDGSFGGEYGSRRTEIYYPGGIALLADEFPHAAALADRMNRSISQGLTTTILDVDFGNTAPLLSNYILALKSPPPPASSESLPCDSHYVRQDFKSAGISIYARQSYYAIAGISNGGVLKVFDKDLKKILLDDCGLLGITKRRNLITSQCIDPKSEISADADRLHIQSRLCFVPTTRPTPFNYLLLRLANLTFMRIPLLNEWVKKLLVKTLIKKDDFIPIYRTRKIEFSDEKIKIVDQIEKKVGTDLVELRMGIKFSAIHMASARYFSLQQINAPDAIELDCNIFNHTGSITQSLQIDFGKHTVERIL